MAACWLEAASYDWRAREMLRPGARFTVCSVFERALNLRDEAGDLLGLVGPRGGNGPASVVLRALPPGGLLRQGLATGQHALVDPAARLVVGDRLVLSLASARLWRAPRPSGPLDPARLAAHLAQAASQALAARPRDGLGGLLAYRAALLASPPPEPPAALSPLLRLAWQALAALLPAWRAADAAAVAAAATGLVGLGPGQTPAGDDLLAGLLVAQARLRPPADPPLAGLAAACLAAAEGRTTDLGLARLHYAAQGELDERSELALAALLGPDPAGVARATTDLLGYGHSSGLDTLVGLLLGCALGAPPGGPLDI